MDDHRVDPLVEALLGLELSPPRLPREDVVCGEHDGSRARKEMDVDGLDGEPLEVDDVGAGGAAARRAREPGAPGAQR